MFAGMIRCAPLFTLTLLIFSCKSETAPPVKDGVTLRFEKYLDAAFEDTIPDPAHFFILIPDSLSFSVINKCPEKLQILTQGRAVNEWTVIAAISAHVSDSVFGNKLVRNDWDNLISRADLPLNGVTVISTVNGSVHKVKGVSCTD